ncbi:MAG: SH3 domain-containing protein [Pseudomonadota bacterium]
MKRFAALVAGLVVLASWTVHAENPAREVGSAADLYAQERYAEAEKTYRGLIDEMGPSSGLHANLARSIFRQERLGEAIYEMRLAHEIAPRDSEIDADLAYLRGEATDQIQPARRNILVRAFIAVESGIGPRGAWVLVVIGMFLTAVSSSARLFLKRGYLTILLCCFAAATICFLSIVVKKELFTRPFGAVIAAESNVYSGPGDSNVLLYKLHDGAEFEAISGAQDGWRKIRLADGKTGWIKASDVVCGMK